MAQTPLKNFFDAVQQLPVTSDIKLVDNAFREWTGIQEHENSLSAYTLAAGKHYDLLRNEPDFPELLELLLKNWSQAKEVDGSELALRLLVAIFFLACEREEWTILLSAFIRRLNGLFDLPFISIIGESAMLMETDNELQQDLISLLCEKYILKKGPIYLELVPSTVSYLLLKSLQPGAKSAGLNALQHLISSVIDVKRVSALRSFFLHFDFNDQSSASLRNLIMYAYTSSIYLRSPDGRKFLSFAFTLHEDFVDPIHQTIKAQLPSSLKTSLDAYGEIYFKAWKQAQGSIRSTIELTCIQDIMNCAVHSNHLGGKNSAAQKLRKLLGYFHNQKKTTGVDEVLYRLYEPIIWRALNAPNPIVRKNAVTLLVDAFPLQNPNSSDEEVDELMQKQFDHLTASLKDEYPEVRRVTVQGLCRILAVFWEWIPSEVTATILNEICGQVSFDSSSPDVRLAVIQGLEYIIENMPLSHITLKRYLQHIGKLIHDISLKNRMALVDLLLTVRKLPDIKFWDIVDLPHLLFRLECDTPEMCTKITSLLINSFFPKKKDLNIKIDRCLVLVAKNPEAARNFYNQLVNYAPVETVIEFTIMLYELLHLCVDGSGGGRVSDEICEKIALNYDQMLDVIAILLNSIIPVLGNEDLSEQRQALVESFELYPLGQLLKSASSDIGISAVFHIAKHALATNVVELGKICQEGLFETTFVTPKQLAMMDCLFGWGLGPDVLNNLMPLLKPHPGAEKTPKPKRKKSNTVESEKSNESNQYRPLACEYINYILDSSTMRQQVINAYVEKDLLSGHITSLLESVFHELDDLLDTQAADMQECFMVLETCFKLAVHHMGNSEDSRLLKLLEGHIYSTVEYIYGLVMPPSSPKKRVNTNLEIKAVFLRALICFGVELSYLDFCDANQLKTICSPLFRMLDTLPDFGGLFYDIFGKFLYSLLQTFPGDEIDCNLVTEHLIMLLVHEKSAQDESLSSMLSDLFRHGTSWLALSGPLLQHFIPKFLELAKREDQMDVILFTLIGNDTVCNALLEALAKMLSNGIEEPSLLLLKKMSTSKKLKSSCRIILEDAIEKNRPVDAKDNVTTLLKEILA